MRVERAIIMAAGFGSRMGDLTKDRPKPLIEVCGQKMIETTIGFLLNQGIKEIYIVVGYKKESFAEIDEKYKEVHLIENKYYDKSNNISSIYMARKYLENCMIIEGDQFFVSGAPLNLEYEHSEYNVIWTNEPTVEWVVGTDDDGRIIECSDTGADRGWLCYGVSRWTKEEGKLLAKYIEEEFEKGNHDIYWDRIPLYYHRMEFNLHIREMGRYERFELDNQEEKKAFEGIYDKIKLLTPKGVCAIEDTFNVKLTEVANVERIKNGLTNTSMTFDICDNKYILRIPGKGTEDYIDRKIEASVYKLLENKGICDNNLYMNEDNGIKISKYINNSRACDYKSIDDMSKCVSLIKKFHNYGLKIEDGDTADIYDYINMYEKLWHGKRSMFSDYECIKEKCYGLKGFIEENNEIFLVHGDCNPTNFLFYEDGGEEKLQLIDWEYAIQGNPLMDLAALITFNDHEKEDVDRLIDVYYENNCSEKQRKLAYAYIVIWGLYLSVWCECRIFNDNVDLHVKAELAYGYVKNYLAYLEKEY